MATLAEELLNSLSESQGMGGMEEHATIGVDRVIRIPEELKRVAVQFDNNVEYVTFDCPRYWEVYAGVAKHDLSQCDEIYINYVRADGEMGMIPVVNLRTDDAGPDTITFSWPIKSHLTQVKGKIRFLVCAKTKDPNGAGFHWNSELNEDLYVSGGLEVEDVIADTYPSVITDILLSLDSKANLDGSNATGEWSIDISGTAAKATEAGNLQHYDITGSTSNEEIPLMLSSGSDTGDKKSPANYSRDLTYNPSTDTISANISGTADKAKLADKAHEATQALLDSNGETITQTYARKSGTNASGTWPINITGSAHRAGTANYAHHLEITGLQPGESLNYKTSPGLYSGSSINQNSPISSGSFILIVYRDGCQEVIDPNTNPQRRYTRNKVGDTWSKWVDNTGADFFGHDHDDTYLNVSDILLTGDTLDGVGDVFYYEVQPDYEGQLFRIKMTDMDTGDVYNDILYSAVDDGSSGYKSSNSDYELTVDTNYDDTLKADKMEVRMSVLSDNMKCDVNIYKVGADSRFKTIEDQIGRKHYFGTCSTDKNTSTKIVECEGFILEKNVFIDVYFENINSEDTMSLNVNNTGAKSVMLYTNETDTMRHIVAGKTVCRFVYDGTQYMIVGFPSMGLSDSSSANSFGRGRGVVTERDAYYATPTINGSKSYTSNTNIYAPTSAGSAGQILQSKGGGAPEWVDYDSDPTAGLVYRVEESESGGGYPILFSQAPTENGDGTGSYSEETEVMYSPSATYTPSTNTLDVNISGNAAGADKAIEAINDSAGNEIINTYVTNEKIFGKRLFHDSVGDNPASYMELIDLSKETLYRIQLTDDDGEGIIYEDVIFDPSDHNPIYINTDGYSLNVEFIEDMWTLYVSRNGEDVYNVYVYEDGLSAQVGIKANRDGSNATGEWPIDISGKAAFALCAEYDTDGNAIGGTYATIEELTDYAKKDGTNATGEWPIDISGKAATADNARDATYASYDSEANYIIDTYATKETVLGTLMFEDAFGDTDASYMESIDLSKETLYHIILTNNVKDVVYEDVIFNPYDDITPVNINTDEYSLSVGLQEDLLELNAYRNSGTKTYRVFIYKDGLSAQVAIKANADGSNVRGEWDIDISGKAASAETANKDSEGNVITDTYATKEELEAVEISGTTDLANYAKKDGSNVSGTWNIDISGMANGARHDTDGNPIDTTYVKIDGSNVYDEVAISISGNAKTVNGYSIYASVPSNAKFTDTTYTAATQSAQGLMSAADKKKLDGIATGANAYSHPNSGVTAGTYRSVTVNAQGHVTAGSNPIITAAQGGTGKTSLNTSANALINSLSTGESAPTDTDYYIAQYAGGGTTTTTYHRRPVSKLWEYIKSKADMYYEKIWTCLFRGYYYVYYYGDSYLSLNIPSSLLHNTSNTVTAYMADPYADGNYTGSEYYRKYVYVKIYGAIDDQPFVDEVAVSTNATVIVDGSDYSVGSYVTTMPVYDAELQVRYYSTSGDLEISTNYSQMSIFEVLVH